MKRTGIKRILLALAFGFLWSVAEVPAAPAGEVIDRIVATVNGHIILQSDWDEALSYEALLSGRAVSLFTDEDRRAVLDRLIDQELLAEPVRQPLRHDPRHDVDRAAGGKADQPVHRAVGVGGGGRRRGVEETRQKDQAENSAPQNSQHVASHCFIVVAGMLPQKPPAAYIASRRC